MSYGHDADNMVVPKPKDCGERRQFPTGAVRDRAVGKGRFDLIPTQMMFRLARHYEAGQRRGTAAPGPPGHAEGTPGMEGW